MLKKDCQRDVWNVLGLPIDVLTLANSIDFINESISIRKNCFLSTPNLNFAIASQSDDVFFQSVVDSDLSVADGMPFIWVAKVLGIPLPERVAGSTLFDELSKQDNAAKKIKVFFFGGQEGVAQQAYQKLNSISSSMVSCGFYDPGFVSVNDMSTTEITDYINNNDPDFIVVALGAKKGQEWIQKNKSNLNAPIISHLGAVINFVAGNVQRAPLIWQRCGMEWLWRVKQEPELWKRYLFDGLSFLKLMLLNVLPLAIYDRILRRTTSFKELGEVDVVQTQEVGITLTGSIHHQVMAEFKEKLGVVIDDNSGDAVFDCAQLKYIDSAFVATTLLFQRYLNEQNRKLYLINVSARVIKILKLNQVENHFTLLDDASF